MIKLSIIVPVYNVEKYIRACMESIFRQGLDEADFEIIIVNDGSQDRSIEIIEDIIQQHDNITVINQENQGLSVTRNNGIALAKGDYILMPDSDDLLIDNSLSFLLEKALSSKADLIVADFIKMDNEEISNFPATIIKQKEITTIEKTGEELFLVDLDPHQCYVWRTLYRRQFLIEKQIRFVPGIFYQDVPFIHECYLKATKCIKTSMLLNIYRVQRPGSATFSYNMKKAKNLCIAIANTWELSHKINLSPELLKKLQDDVFTSISVMLWCTSHEIKNVSDRVKVIDFLKEKAPDLNLQNGIKQKIFTIMFKRMPHTLIHCRYFYDFIIEDRLLPFYRHKIKNAFK